MMSKHFSDLGGCHEETNLIFELFARARAEHRALAADYTDVPADSWARESIDKAAEHGLMNGVGEGRFGLGQDHLARAFVTILVRCSAGRA